MGDGLECVGGIVPVDLNRAANTAIEPCLATLAVDMANNFSAD
ncbi:MAG: hypothetical protein OXD36_16005 [Rhodobacter sp.]|nr:hypothetical protein [Rhodobacter sp.]